MIIRTYLYKAFLLFFLPTRLVYEIFRYLSRFEGYIIPLAIVVLGVLLDIGWGYGLFFSFYSLWLWTLYLIYYRVPDILWQWFFSFLWIILLLIKDVHLWYLVMAIVMLMSEVWFYEKNKRLIS